MFVEKPSFTNRQEFYRFNDHAVKWVTFGKCSMYAFCHFFFFLFLSGNVVNGGFTGMGNMITECYQETATNGISTNFTPHPPPMYPQGHPQSLHLLPQPLQGTFYQAPGTSFGLPINSALHGSVNTFQGSMEVVPGYVGPAPPGIAVYPNTHGRALLPGATLRHHALPRFNLLPADVIFFYPIDFYI